MNVMDGPVAQIGRIQINMFRSLPIKSIWLLMVIEDTRWSGVRIPSGPRYLHIGG